MIQTHFPWSSWRLEHSTCLTPLSLHWMDPTHLVQPMVEDLLCFGVEIFESFCFEMQGLIGEMLEIVVAGN